MNQITAIYNNINSSIDLIDSFNIKIPNKLRFGPDYDCNAGFTENLDDDMLYMSLYILELKKWLEELDTILHKEFF